MAQHQDRHPSDQDLLHAADGELPVRALAQVNNHLAECEACRERMSRMEDLLGRFVHLYREELNSQIPAPAGPLALFRTRLSTTLLAANEPGRWKIGLMQVLASPAAIAAAAILVLFAGALIVNRLQFSLTDGEQVTGQFEPDAVPRPNLTPGAISALPAGDVCDEASRNLLVARVPSALSRQVFDEYGIRNPFPGAYEVDYLITPDLGGSADLKNLWPEPYFDVKWNARVKDALEVRLHSLVCKGDLDLKTAQQGLATNWIAAYIKYFHSNRPLSDRASAVAEGVDVRDNFADGPPTVLARSRVPFL